MFETNNFDRFVCKDAIAACKSMSNFSFTKVASLKFKKATNTIFRVDDSKDFLGGCEHNGKTHASSLFAANLHLGLEQWTF